MVWARILIEPVGLFSPMPASVRTNPDKDVLRALFQKKPYITPRLAQSLIAEEQAIADGD